MRTVRVTLLRAALCGAALLTLPGAAPAQEGPQAGTRGDTHAVIVVGLGGAAEYRDAFHGYGLQLYTALTQRHGIPAENVMLLAEREELVPGVFHARSTRDDIQAALGQVAARAGAQDRILIVLIGHGTAQGDDARFNLPGPDLAPAELAMGLAAFPTQTVAVVHTGSASGGFVAPLSGPNRVVVAATRTARERNATEFPRFFVEALTDEEADLDKDGGTSLLEAFIYSLLEVQRFYEEEGEILTEHAVLDDNGDGEGSADAGPDGPDGILAGSFILGGTAATATTTDDPVLARLYSEREEIQSRIEALRALRDTLEEATYEARMEELLVELALKAREIRAREGGGA